MKLTSHPAQFGLAAVFLACSAAFGWASLAAPAQTSGGQDVSNAGIPDEASREALGKAFAEQGLLLDWEQSVCGLPVEVEITEDLLEYLLVGPGGAAHESLFSTDVLPSLLNTALLSLGVEPGKNASYTNIEPAPTPEEAAAGAPAYKVKLPEGDRFYLYVAWRDGEETFFFRVEDLIANRRSGRSMQRHGWTYLGSRLVPNPTKLEEEIFAADIYRNLINLAFFNDGYTLLTSSIEACVDQNIWMANPWLLPSRGDRALFLFARNKLERVPTQWLPELPLRSTVSTEGR